MKRLLTIIFLLATVSGFSQFRMVGTGTWSTVNDSTYTATVNFQSDLTGQGYLATAIVDTFLLFTPTEQTYRISNVANKTFSSADLTIVETNGTNGQPVGQVCVYDPAGEGGTIPQPVFGSTGATAQLQAAVDAWNARQNKGSQTSTLDSADVSIIYDDLTSGTVTAMIGREGGTATTIANPAAGEYDLTIAGGAVFVSAEVFGNNTTLNGSNEMIIRVDNSANSRNRRLSLQVLDANNGALVDQQATATNHTLTVAGNITTITVPGLNGFGSTGYYILIR